MKTTFRIGIVSVFLFLFVLPTQAQDVEMLLFELPDVIFEKIDTTDDYGQTYQLMVKQPLDHFDKSKGYFHQLVNLTHVGFDRPVVMETEGYKMYGGIDELTKLLDANKIQIEHRYFGKSVPDSLDYTYLTMKQVTTDLHRINQLFKKIYQGKWVSTGISKGGLTTIIYKYFYPNDVIVSIPYVAALTTEFEDQRIYTFLDTIGTDECRSKIKSLQIRLLENRDKVLPLLKFYSIGAELEYSCLSFEKAFEYSVLEFPFSFWQSNGSCNAIPTDDIPLQEAVEYFISADPLWLFSDEAVKYFEPQLYQRATELGYYGYEIDDFKNLIRALPTDSNPHATYLSSENFDDTLLKKVNKWIKTDANKFIYINGSIDTWSACAVQPSKEVDSKWFFLEGKHHGNARIKNMNEKEKQELVSTLESWLSIDIEE